jgi:CelD/BcsL family acetyltransferase involved in cellulose biosynthesis
MLMPQGITPYPVRTTTIYKLDDLAPHIPAWDRLAWDAPQRIPTLFPAWVDAFLRHGLAANERWFCVFAYSGDELIGVLPVIVPSYSILGQQRPLLRTLTDPFITSSGDILLAPDQAVEALTALLVQCDQEVPGHLGLDLPAVRQNSPVWAALQTSLRDYIVCTDLVTPYSLINVQGEFATYAANLGNLRRNLTRYRKKLKSRGDVSVELRKGPAAGEDFLPEFLALEASGWKGRNGTALLNDPNQTAFFTTLIANLAKQERLEWHILRVEDRIVAAGIGVQCRGAVVLPRIAYDEEYAECMPGNLLTEEVIKDAFLRPELVELNHMSNASWHATWRMSHDRYTDVHLVRRRASAVLFRLPRVAASSVYQKHVRPRIPNAMRKARQSFRRREEIKARRVPERKVVPLEVSRAQYSSEAEQIKSQSHSVLKRVKGAARNILALLPRVKRTGNNFQP